MLDVEIVSQQELMWRGDANQVVVPALGGSMGILINHTPFVSLLESGNVVVEDQNNQKHVFHIDGDAFVTLTANQVIIVADEIKESQLSEEPMV